MIISILAGLLLVVATLTLIGVFAFASIHWHLMMPGIVIGATIGGAILITVAAVAISRFNG